MMPFRSMVPYTHPRFPDLLKEIYDPPLVLFARGNLDLLASPMMAVVGTRRSTPYGMAAADKLSTDMAIAGLTIVSGMARGIDTVAHKAALKVGGKTVAVFGAGVDHIYPAENRGLADDIASRGLLLSEYPMASPAHPQNFPRRNRVISGLSHGVLIVEGAQYSGSAITARLALDQSRDVFAVPGPITAKMSWAPNLLIKQGAKLVQDSEDILSELRPETRRLLMASLPQLPPEEDSNRQKQMELQLGPNAPVARAILDLLKIEESIQLDQLLEKLDQCSSTEVIAVLFELELGGAVRQLPGKNFVRVW
jgi:DNA processing protein